MQEIFAAESLSNMSIEKLPTKLHFAQILTDQGKVHIYAAEGK